MSEVTLPVDPDAGVVGTAAVKTPRPSAIRLRAFIVGVAFIPINSHWVLMMEKVRSGHYPSTISIFANAIFVLAVLAALNALLRRTRPRMALTSAEMLLIYTMIAISTALAGHDLIPNLVGGMVYPWRFATPENLWTETFIPFLPKGLTVSDPGAVKALYEGRTSFLGDGYWMFWLKPAINWLVFILVLVFVMMCINTLVRKLWTDRERLTFPLVTLPVSMAEPSGEIWRSRLFWIAFAIAFLIDLVNGLSVYLPSVPPINVGHEERDLASGLINKPWSGLGWTPYSFYPFVIGIGYLLPADLSFSCWFFYLFWKMQSVGAAMAGWDAIPGFPYVRHQAFGGFVAILLTLTWASRGYWQQVWLRIKNERSELDDSDEAISYRAAAAGALGGFIFLCAFMMWIGMSPLVAVASFIVYFILAVAIARIRAELGPPVHDFHFTGPDFVLISGVGLGRLSDGDLIGLSQMFWFTRAYRCHPMPIGIEGMKMADSAKTSQRSFFWGIMLAVLVGTIATFWVYLHLGYKLGFDTGMRLGGAFISGGYRDLAVRWTRPENALGPNWGGSLAMMGGFIFCSLLWIMHVRVLNWPFHPIGYAISASYSINLVWVPLLIAWLIKVNILRFGGLRLYKAAIPFFLGLILGEMTIGCILSLIGITFNIPYYNFWGA